MKQISKTTAFKIISVNDLKDTHSKLSQGVGLVEPNNIELQLFNLKKSTLIKRSPLLQNAIHEYENGHIKLFNTTGINNTVANLPLTLPYLPMANGDVYMNLNRVCSWSADMSTLTNLAELTDLRAILEFGYVLKSLNNGNNKDSLFKNSVFIEKLTRIYIYLFYNVICRCLGASQTSSIDSVSVNMKYAIAKFFLNYCIEMESDDVASTIAYTIVKNANTTFNSIAMHEENIGLDYSSLEGFLKSFALSFFGNNLTVSVFYNTWIKLYGEQTIIATESPEILLYFAYMTYYNARLGVNNTRLVTRHKEQINTELTKIVSIIYTVVR